MKTHVILCLFLGALIYCLPISGEEINKDNKAEENKDKVDKNDSDKKETDDKEKQKEEEPPKIGNFALPSSQQPGPLVSFGENIIDKGVVELFFFADRYIGKHKIITDLIPSVLVGITDDWSIFFNAPFTPQMKDDGHQSRGLEDFFFQLEYAFYNKKSSIYFDQATLVANITVPTGSSKKTPPTGFGAPSLFIGATYSHMQVDWFVFTSHGAVLTASDHGTKFGDQFFYEFGFGRNICSPEGWIYAWMVEIDGQYNKKNRIRGKIDPNSGGNTIFVTPSIWISSKKLIIQFGVGFPVHQNLFGQQHKFDYSLVLNIGWTLY